MSNVDTTLTDNATMIVAASAMVNVAKTLTDVAPDLVAGVNELAAATGVDPGSDHVGLFTVLALAMNVPIPPEQLLTIATALIESALTGMEANDG